MPFSRSRRSVLAALIAAVVAAVLTIVLAVAVGTAGPATSESVPPVPRVESRNGTLCGAYCDDTPAADPAPYRAAGTAEVQGRVVRLRIDDADQTAVADIDAGDPHDEVWIDRSWDGGKSWDGKVGGARIRPSARSATTTQWNLNDDQGGAGVVRACGKASNRGQIACTGWSGSLRLPDPGSTWDRAAVDALMSLYDRDTGLWPDTGWWNSANALTALIDYMSATNDHEYLWVVANTFDRNRTAKSGQFTNDFMDDTGWWALAWTRAYDLTHEQRYLRTAQADVDYMWSYRDDVCGGGLWWSAAKDYKNAITNELFIKAAAGLHNRIPGDRTYLQQSLSTWRWFRDSGMVNGDHLVNDGLDASCKNNNDTTWTYNQGVILGGLVELADATDDQSYLSEATVLADASTTAEPLHADGHLTEPCDATDCGPDGPSFKGIYVRNLGELARATSSSAYRDYLKRTAETVHDGGRTPYDQYGGRWAGPIGEINGATQQSAVDLMVAALH